MSQLIGFIESRIRNSVMRAIGREHRLIWHAANKHESNVNEADRSPVADAIHSYRRRRETHERERAKRERVTIVVLVFTAVFAFLAAIAAGVSALIFSGQLGEMHQTSV
jgi:hypothetical protein